LEDGEWHQLGDDIAAGAAGDISDRGVAISSDGLTVVIGAPLNDGEENPDGGHVRVYNLDVSQCEAGPILSISIY
jgi:hypothetical protein